MDEVLTYSEALAVLNRYIPLARQITGKNITLARMKPLMSVLGNPQKYLNIVHVAGTSGKTSTSYYLSSLLSAGGRKVGLSVSPHVDSVTERIQVNLRPITEFGFASAVHEVDRIIRAANIEPTYFEFMVGLAYWYFNKIGVDYAVIETGLGGQHDSTNIADSEDKICIITDIGFDHTHVLGESIKAIATQKAGIIHAKNEVFMHEQSEEITQVIQQRCYQAGAQLNLVKGYGLAPARLPSFQRRNLNLAQATYEFIVRRDGLPQLSDNQLIESSNVYIPARMDEVQIEDTHIIMDGAHNEQKMQAFIESFKEMHPGIKVPILFSLKQSKEFEEVLTLLKPITSSLILTAYNMGLHFPSSAINPSELAAAARRLGFSQVSIQVDAGKAFEQLLKKKPEVAIVTGSFYLIFQLRQLRKELRNHGPQN